MATPMETSLVCLSEEWMGTQRVLMLVNCWVRLTELCLELLTGSDLEHLKETPKGKSLGCSSAQWMAIQKVLMTESDWVELTEMNSGLLMESLMELSLACLMVE